MTDFKRPLVAYSMTDSDDALLSYVARLSECFGWEDIHFLHVVPPGNPPSVELSVTEGRLRTLIEHRFGSGAAGFSYHAAEGSRLDHMLRVVVESDCDLVLLGHRQMRSGRRSLARRAAMVAPCSVWLVPEGSPPEISGILVPTDFSDHSADALSVAARVARAAGVSECHAMHVFFDPSSVRFDDHLDEILGQEEEAFQKFIADVDTQGIEIQPVFHESADPPHAIVRMAERSGLNLIVMNTRGRSRAACVLLGSTTSETIAETSVPLLAVKHYGSRMTLLDALVSHRVWERKTPKMN